eukprot:scaffold117332_cov18-Prasinocladus_malaysianus.AAC.1
MDRAVLRPSFPISVDHAMLAPTGRRHCSTSAAWLECGLLQRDTYAMITRVRVPSFAYGRAP